MLTTTPPVNQPATSHSRHFLAPRGCRGQRVRPRTQVYECSKNVEIVAFSRTAITPYKLANWIHMSLERSEIGSDQGICEQPKSWCDYPPRLSHDDFARCSPNSAEPQSVVGWCRTILGIVRPTVCRGQFGGPRRDFSRLGTTLQTPRRPPQPSCRVHPSKTSPPKCACMASPLFSSEPPKSVSSRSSAQILRNRKSRT